MALADFLTQLTTSLFLHSYLDTYKAHILVRWYSESGGKMILEHVVF